MPIYEYWNQWPRVVSSNDQGVLREQWNEGSILIQQLHSSSDILKAIQDGQITADDSILLFSIDGAQLYKNKASDLQKALYSSWWFIPGLKGPKNLDSFIFPGFYHLAALQKEGLLAWDAARNDTVTDYPFLAFGTADMVGMADMSGTVGHQGRYGCCLACIQQGRHKPGCDHPDQSYCQSKGTSEELAQRYSEYLLKVQQSRNQTQYESNRLDTGICKPTLFSGLQSQHTLGMPACFPSDLMHLVSLNLTNLLILLWHGKFKCDKNDSKTS
ncbi:hypothetical protein HETIRDRAFT_174760 [Heterobasidion irregulare TC 32-1]|uniref:Uncharacterized protein n=1 Tax=Heterobasidion irregulare (strain TC 32-1) TaxID=747525 RepID=W4JTB2_HETIT|nr:uncharacterized protein HETIRDRAFT_174760 [Heterobasidion irregulare TC 32-1]ETW76704.1 hypothetical protein HETIRDRAFT_174760 [Heterobasidion irregulare TC 32-1]